jgi:hypothetical protein
MKKCPKCNRTYADEFTFCLEDGALLSAPYNPEEQKPVAQQRAVSPATAVMPVSPASQPTATIPSPPPTKPPEAVITDSRFGGETPRKSFASRYVALAVVLVVMGVVAMGLYAFAKSDCPPLTISMYAFSHHHILRGKGCPGIDLRPGASDQSGVMFTIGHSLACCPDAVGSLRG